MLTKDRVSEMGMVLVEIKILKILECIICASYQLQHRCIYFHSFICSHKTYTHPENERKDDNLVVKVFLSNLNKNFLFREIRPFNSIRLKSILIKEI